MYWDEKETVEKAIDKYSSRIELIPSKEVVKGQQLEIAGFKHYFGVPASFYVDASKKIIAMTKGAATVGLFPGKGLTEEVANQKNYDRIKSKVEEILSSKN